jgi:hypothetical protein
LLTVKGLSKGNFVRPKGFHVVVGSVDSSQERREILKDEKQFRTSSSAKELAYDGSAFDLKSQTEELWIMGCDP